MLRKFIPAIAFALLGLVACQEDRPTDRPGPSGKALLSVSVEALPEPNHYQARLTWPAISTGSWIISRREGSAPEPVQLATLEPSAIEYVDATIVANRSYEYVLGETHEGSYRIAGRARILVPRDMRFEGVAEVPSIEGVKRLFLAEGTRLQTHGKEVRIEAEELFAPSAVIETFPDGAAASDGRAGKNGGKLTLLLKRGRGQLEILARGENGGRGLKGATGEAGSKGGTGRNGQCGHRINQDFCKISQQDLRQWREMAAKPGFPGSTFQHFLNNFFCAVDTGNGGTGTPGRQGGKGGTGGRGGDSASVFVQVADPSGIRVKVTPIAGAGGLGGEGGDGGAGGPGGNPGVPDSLGICRAAGIGPQGATGPRGASGETGARGTVSALCLRLGSATYGDCAAPAFTGN